MELERRTLDRIAQQFASAQQPDVVSLLSSYSGPEPRRVVWDILQLSMGDLAKVRGYVQDASRDYRDILYWAEYFDTDPLLRGRDPRQMVEDLLAKWGDKKKP